MHKILFTVCDVHWTLLDHFICNLQFEIWNPKCRQFHFRHKTHEDELNALRNAVSIYPFKIEMHLMCGYNSVNINVAILSFQFVDTKRMNFIYWTLHNAQFKWHLQFVLWLRCIFNGNSLSVSHCKCYLDLERFTANIFDFIIDGGLLPAPRTHSLILEFGWKEKKDHYYHGNFTLNTWISICPSFKCSDQSPRSLRQTINFKNFETGNKYIPFLETHWSAC